MLRRPNHRRRRTLCIPHQRLRRFAIGSRTLPEFEHRATTAFAVIDTGSAARKLLAVSTQSCPAIN